MISKCVITDFRMRLLNSFASRDQWPRGSDRLFVAFGLLTVDRCDMSCGGRSASFDMSQGYSLLPSFSCPPPRRPPSLNELYLVPKET